MKVVDMHCDTIGAIFEKRNKGIACNLRKNDLHLDVNKMEQGNYLMQNFAMFIDLKRYKNPYKTLLDMIECYDKEIEDNKEHPYHKGDLPLIYSSNGEVHTDFLINKFNLDDIIGRSIIIHSQSDDFKSQPSGDSGDKIACGEIISNIRLQEI